MSLDREILFVALAQISLTQRQRSELWDSSRPIEQLASSIRRHGVLNPLIVRQSGDGVQGSYELVAGHRRLEASKLAGLAEVPVRLASSLSPREAKLIELEENIKRKDLSWLETAGAVREIHELFLAEDPEWTRVATAEQIGLSDSYVGRLLQVDDALAQPDGSGLAKAQTLNQAVNVLRRREARAVAGALESMFAPEPLQSEPSGDGEAPALPPADVLCADFISWAQAYSGPRFGVLHVDFPYGVGLFSAADSHQIQKLDDSQPRYDDSREVYMALVDALLENLDRFMASAGHMIFWYGAQNAQWTRELFALRRPELIFNPHALIWMKSDNAGMVPDVRRSPRHVYETAWLISRGDQLLVQTKADAYAAPTDNALHASAKPLPVLKHFLSLVVDRHTSVLDPSCGAGTSLLAADALGAERLLGIDIEPKFAELSQTRLSNQRTLRRAALAL